MNVNRGLGLALFLVAQSMVVGTVEAQQRNDLLVLGTRTEIESSVLDETRTLWIYTPPAYDSSNAQFPVLYLLDGDVHFRHATGLVDFLSYNLRAPQLIVVGILNTSRTSDFTPPAVSGRTSRSGTGGANRFLRFLSDEVKPYVEREYRTAPFSILAGHSFGGLFTVHTLVQSPDAFDAHIAISPSLYWDDSATVKAAREVLAPERGRSGFLYLSLGERERAAIAASTRSLAQALESGTPETFEWSFDEFAGENHLTVPYPALHAGMRWLFDGWSLPFDGIVAQIASDGNINAFSEHFDRLSARYGFPVLPTERIMGLVGTTLVQQREFDGAVLLLRRRVELYPESPVAHDALARGLEAAGQRDQALESYERALALAAAQRHPSLEAIRRRMARLRDSE